jgi:hypothetical protein
MLTRIVTPKFEISSFPYKNGLALAVLILCTLYLVDDNLAVGT